MSVSCNRNVLSVGSCLLGEHYLSLVFFWYTIVLGLRRWTFQSSPKIQEETRTFVWTCAISQDTNYAKFTLCGRSTTLFCRVHILSITPYVYQTSTLTHIQSGICSIVSTLVVCKSSPYWSWKDKQAITMSLPFSKKEGLACCWILEKRTETVQMIKRDWWFWKLHKFFPDFIWEIGGNFNVTVLFQVVLNIPSTNWKLFCGHCLVWPMAQNLRDMQYLTRDMDGTQPKNAFGKTRRACLQHYLKKDPATLYTF